MSHDNTILHRFRTVEGVDIFYREAGDPQAPAIVPLSGHPSGAHAYNRLIERLPESWRVLAQDYPGYGFSAAGTRFQWEAGARDPAHVDPATWTLDQALLDAPGRRQAAKALLWDYQNNPGRYPEWQAYLREKQPPLLAIWGANDPFFIAPGAQAYKRDVPSAEVVLLDTGHFALIEEVDAVAERVDRFLQGVYASPN